ncbi:hypothetical protein BH10PSE3_BH10PSE3_19680 [soil metagenome]
MPTQIATLLHSKSDAPTDGLARASPEAHGVSSDAIEAFLQEAARLGVELNSFMIWRGGDVIAEGWWKPYRADRRHMMHSATKSFLSAGVGLAIAEGRFGLDDKVVSFFPQHLPDTLGPHLPLMTVEDLLTQTSGHAHGTSGAQWRGIATSWIAEFFKIPVPFKPGTAFRYTSATSFMLSAILSQTTGDNAHAYLKPRLLEPLGIDDLAWDVGPENINPGGNGISARTADLLKLAILHLGGGVWNGDRILSEDWVRAAVTAKRGNPYGYHWWVGPRGAFYAYGVFGQFAFVFPDHNAIVVTTAATPYGEETLRSLIWTHFPAAFGPIPLPETVVDAAPRSRWRNLDLLPSLARSSPATQSAVSGKTVELEPNADNATHVRLEFGADRCVFHIEDSKGAHQVVCGLGDWIEGETTVSGAPLHHGYEPASLKVVAGGQWTDPTTFEMTWQFVETAFRDQVTLRFQGEAVTCDRTVNTNSLSTARPTLRGQFVEKGN